MRENAGKNGNNSKYGHFLRSDSLDQCKKISFEEMQTVTLFNTKSELS